MKEIKNLSQISKQFYSLISTRYILLWTILLFIPVFIQDTKDSFIACLILYSKTFISYLGFSVILSFIIGLLSSCFSRIKPFLHILVTCILTFFTFIDVFLTIKFRLRLYYETIKLFFDTNQTEASEFVHLYIFSFSTILLLFAYLVLFIIISKVSVKMKMKHKIISAIACTILLLSAAFGANNFIKYYICYGKYDAPASVFQGTFYNILVGIKSIQANSNDIQLCLKANQSIKDVHLEPNVKDVVLIIGESFIKSHSSLYGYELQTNERLSEYSDKTFLFSDVITSVNYTSEAIRNMFLVSNSNDTINNYSVPMLPAIVKKAGVNVVFYSNQFVMEQFQTVFDALGSFYMNDSIIGKQMYSKRNSRRYTYDEDLIDDFITNRDKLETNQSNLIIFHLLGQHENRKDRFPAQFNFFTADSIKRDLLSIQKQKIADYDNATRYNDYVVSKIFELYKNKDALVIYLSDHGEECYDFRNKNGRAVDFDSNNGLCGRYQLDIPFMIFATDTCRNTHPELIHQIEKSVHRPYMTDDLPHLIMNLLGVKSSYYRPDRDLINNKYDSKRKRIVIRNTRYYNYDTMHFE